MTLNIIRKLKGYFVKDHHANWAMVDQALVSGSNLVLNIVLARILGITEYGVYALAMLIVMFANMVQQAAIIAPMMSIGPKQGEAERASYYGGVMVQALIFAIASAMATYIGAELLGQYIEWQGVAALGVPLSLSVGLMQLQDFSRRYFFVANKARLSFVSDAIRYLGYLFILLFYLRRQYQLNAENAFWSASGAALVSLLVVLPELYKLSFTLDTFMHYLGRHWKFSKWLTASSILQWFSGNVFTMAAGGVLGSTAVGALKAAQTLLGVTHIIFLAFENFAPIKVARLYHEGRLDEMTRYLFNTAAVGLIVVLPVAAIASFFAKFWFSHLFGPSYLPYSFLVGWVSLLYVSMALVLPLRFWLRAIENNKPLFYAYTISSFTFPLLAHAIITRCGVVAVPLSSLAIQGLILLTMLFYFRSDILCLKVKRM